MGDQAPPPDAFTIPFQITKGMHRDIYSKYDPKNSALSAAGKVIIITGATGGIGYKVAEAWSIAGAAGIVLFGRDSSKLEAVAKNFKTPVLTVAGTVTDEASVKAAYEKTIAKFGKVDVLVNSAGSFAFGAMTGTVEPSAWWADYETNIRGTYNMIHYFIKSTGGKGTIVNLVSLGASFTNPGMSSYGPSKLAVIKIGELLDAEHPELRVFSVHPGIVEAEDGRGMVIDMFTPFAKDKALLTGAVSLYLSTPAADHLKGSFISVNWDLDELEAHKSEVAEKKLLRLGFLNGQLQPGGYNWS